MAARHSHLARTIWIASGAAGALFLLFTFLLTYRGANRFVGERRDLELREFAVQAAGLANQLLAAGIVPTPGTLAATDSRVDVEIVNEQGIIVSSTDPQHPAGEAAPNLTGATGGGVLEVQDAHGREHIATVPLQRAGWTLVLRQQASTTWSMRGLLHTIWLELVLVAIVGGLLLAAIVAYFRRRVVEPLVGMDRVVSRVAVGDLTAPSLHLPQSRDEVGQLGTGVTFMVNELRNLVESIRSASGEAATLALQISASTQQMSASTEEVAGTCGDLTDRANKQAALVRATAVDASRILNIAQGLAEGAREAADRNASLARVARGHQEQLDASSTQLERLAEEIELGLKEAEALAAASEEIGKFVVQTKTIARQTHMLALNAGIEAARAGAEGRGFAVVAEEVRKLAGQAAQAATTTSQTVDAVQIRVRTARERLLRLAEGGVTARDAANTAASGLNTLASEAEANDSWTRQISGSSREVRELVQGIVQRMTDVSEGTEEFAAAAQQIAASAQELSASTIEIAHSASQLSQASDRLTGAVSRFQLERAPEVPEVERPEPAGDLSLAPSING